MSEPSTEAKQAADRINALMGRDARSKVIQQAINAATARLRIDVATLTRARDSHRKQLDAVLPIRIEQDAAIAKLRKELEQAKRVEQVCYDLHEALGVKWGDDPYAAITKLREEVEHYRNILKDKAKAMDELREENEQLKEQQPEGTKQ